MKRLIGSVLFAVLGILLLAACGQVSCGTGTYQQGNVCVSTTSAYGSYGSGGYSGYNYPH